MSSIDVANDPYGRRYYAHKKRVEFEKLKRTPEFKAWRNRQLRIQKKLCAYCQISLTYKNIVTHVDHINPLYYEGSNNFENLVLSCRRCNLKKWVNNRIVEPDWIKKNRANYPKVQQLSTLRGLQKKQMQDLVAKELDEQSIDWLRDVCK